MSLAELRPGLTFARVNPVAKLGAAIPVSIALVWSLDAVAPLVVIGAALVVFLAAGLGRVAFSRRTLAIWLAAPFTGISMLLYGAPSGRTFLEFGLVHVTEGSVGIAVATTLRIIALAWPAAVLAFTIDPTDLADGLAQTLRLPSRFVLGGLAAMRLAGSVFDDWRTLALARRARGAGDGIALARFARQCFALLVLAIRRGGVLATAMEGRGFDAPVARTWARPARFGTAEWAFLAAGLAIAALAVAVSVGTGSWNAVFVP